METPLLADAIYHIYTHANGEENLFRSEDNFHYFLKKYAEHIYPVAETYAYCLMPNHLHLAVKMRSEEVILEYWRNKKTAATSNLQGSKNIGGLNGELKGTLEGFLSQQFSNLFNAYSKAFNKMYNRKGSLFIPNFKRKIVESDRYFTQLIIYIHHNPIYHGFVKQLLDWPHSSIHAYVWDKPSKLNRQYLLHWVGNKEQLLLLHENINFDQDLFDL